MIDQNDSTPAIVRQLLALRAQVDALIVQAREQHSPHPELATAKHNPAGNEHTFRRVLRTRKVRAWKRGREVVCSWVEFQRALEAEEWRPPPRPEPTEDPGDEIDQLLASGDLEARR